MHIHNFPIFPCHRLKPDDYVYIKVFKHKNKLIPGLFGAFPMLLVTDTTVRCEGRTSTHHTMEGPADHECETSQMFRSRLDLPLHILWSNTSSYKGRRPRHNYHPRRSNTLGPMEQRLPHTTLQCQDEELIVITPTNQYLNW